MAGCRLRRDNSEYVRPRDSARRGAVFSCLVRHGPLASQIRLFAGCLFDLRHRFLDALDSQPGRSPAKGVLPEAGRESPFVCCGNWHGSNVCSSQSACRPDHDSAQINSLVFAHLIPPSDLCHLISFAVSKSFSLEFTHENNCMMQFIRLFCYQR